MVRSEFTARALADGDAEQWPQMFAAPLMFAHGARLRSTAGATAEAGRVGGGRAHRGGNLAPTAIGSAMVCSARFDEAQAALSWFDVWAEDDQRRIGGGRIACAIVAEAKLTASAGAWKWRRHERCRLRRIEALLHQVRFPTTATVAHAGQGVNVAITAHAAQGMSQRAPPNLRLQPPWAPSKGPRRRCPLDASHLALARALG